MKGNAGEVLKKLMFLVLASGPAGGLTGENARLSML